MEPREMFPEGTDDRPWPYYILMMRKQPIYLRFLGKYKYKVLGIVHPYQATNPIHGGWEVLNPAPKENPKEHEEEAWRHWAIHNHPLLVWLFGLSHPELVLYRTEWSNEWGRSFWDA